MTQPTLLGYALREELSGVGKTLTISERTVIDRFVMLDNKRLDADDLLETLEAIEDGDVVVEPRMGDVLVKLRVLETRGNRNSHGAVSGENFELLKTELARALKKDRR